MRSLPRIGLLVCLVSAPGCAELKGALAPKSKAQEDQEAWDKKKQEEEAKKQKEGDAALVEAEAWLKRLREETEATAIASDAEVEAAFRKVERAPKEVAWDRLAQHAGSFRGKLNDEVRALQLLLARKAADSESAAVWGRTALYQPFTHEPKLASPEMHELIRRLGAQFDAVRAAQFQKHGWCRTGPASNDVVCAFSDQPFPEDLSTVQPVLRSHLESDVVYVLARLPQPAKSYGDRMNARFTIQLSARAGGSLLDQVEVGSPEAIGDTDLLRASFRLPPRKAQASMRHWIEANVVLFWQVPGIVEPVEKHLVLCNGSLTWHEAK